MTVLYFPAPATINGEKLVQELTAAGFPAARPYVAGDEVGVTGVEESDRSAVGDVVQAHTGEPSVEQQANTARQADADSGISNLATTAGIRAKCKAVLAGTDTFTAAQRDRAIAALVLLALRDRSDT